MDGQIKRLLKQSVEYYRFVSVTGAGDKTFDPPITIPCYIEGRITTIRDLIGEEHVSRQVLLINGTDLTHINNEDEFVLPGSASRRAPLHIQPYYNEAGQIDIWEVYF